MSAGAGIPSPAPLPPLSLSTGPAVSGSSPVSSGNVATGDFFARSKPTLADRVFDLAPVIVLAGLAWWIARRG